MSDVERRFHETWLGMVQPIDGLVVSVPVLVDAQCMERQPPHLQQRLLELCSASNVGESGSESRRVADLGAFLTDLLGLAPDAFDADGALPEELSLFVPEGKQVLRPTMGLRRVEAPVTAEGAESTPASTAGARYELLVWDLGAFAGGAGLDLDQNETVTGPWDYPTAAKFDRLLRHCRVPVGLLTNRDVVRLVYAPHGESSGAITFRIDDMSSVGGRPILDAFVMLLSANRFFGVTAERTLPAILAESRKRQANVTNELAEQVFDALQILLRGFEAAAERDGDALLRDALTREGDHLYKGLLTVLLRLVFILYAEDRGLLPVEHPTYARGLSILSLFEELQSDHGAYPDSMARRFGAWGRLVTLFRAVFLGVSHGDLQMPPRRGSLFDPHTYPFLEGWGPAGGAPITQPEDRAAARLPSVDDQTVFRVLEKLLVFEGQRLSYRALDVEQIGSVYEALMGYHVVRTEAPAVCMRPDRLWVTVEEVLAVPAARRSKWIKETIGLTTAQAQKLADELGDAADAASTLDALARFAAGGKSERDLARARVGQLVLQPGTERRRTSSHYTPRSLSAPIVRRTIEPLLAVMSDEPASERILRLKICDPAMGSGAFLVEACRFLADHVLAAWTREREPDGASTLERIAREHGDPVLYARRLVAQRCLYGVDKNEAAVELAKLSLWLVTLSKTLPFTFLDHAFRHGDSLVGLDFDQLRAFHWNPPVEDAQRKKKRAKTVPDGQLSLFGREIDVALSEAISLRQKIGELGDAPLDDREKERLLWDAQDALDRVRLIGDVLVGAFFAHEKDKEREKERARREDLVRAWLGTGGPPTTELRGMQSAVRALLPVFHWMVEFPEIFYAERPDPLDADATNSAAFMDAFVGNPPFLGGTRISVAYGDGYRDWLADRYDASSLTDLCVFFFRRAADLLGRKGTGGFIATNSVAQGDSRTTGLSWICTHGGTIYEAVRSMPWPGDAAVSVSVVHFALRLPQQDAVLDHRHVPRITSFLTTRGSEEPPKVLDTNKGQAVIGSFVLGVGFVFEDGNEGATTLATMRLLFERDPRNRERVFNYLGGEDLNSDPRQASSRYVIDFGDLDEPSARAWPDLFKIVETKVKPARETVQQRDRREEWWRHATRSPVLRNHLQRHGRALAISQVTAHLAFSFITANVVISHTTVAILAAGYTTFSIVQSRIHEPWARLHSSSLETRLRYTPSDCFETFPFPMSAPAALIASLEGIGQRLYEVRMKYMADESVGLTVTYNRLKDPACTEERILVLRALHEEMDRVVLSAYAENDPEGNWSAVVVPPFCPLSDADNESLEAFEDAVIDRLFALNAKRAAAEKASIKLVKAPKKPAAPAIASPPAVAASPALTIPLPFSKREFVEVAPAASMPAAVRAKQWSRAHGPGDTLAALVAVLRAYGEPTPKRDIRLATLLCLEPHLLVPQLDADETKAWQRAIGQDARKAIDAQVDANLGREWGDAIAGLRGRDLVLPRFCGHPVRPAMCWPGGVHGSEEEAKDVHAGVQSGGRRARAEGRKVGRTDRTGPRFDRDVGARLGSAG